jgi:carbonic anhydrase
MTRIVISMAAMALLAELGLDHQASAQGREETLKSIQTSNKVDEVKTKMHHYFSKSEHQHAVEWGYQGKTGPAHWGELSPEFHMAKDGRKQSPIDIPLNATISQNLPPLKFEYQKELLSVVNNGHAIQHDERPGSFLHVGESVYALEQFHVHLPSEHTIDGKHFDMEIHFVHRSEEGKVAVVAVMVAAGDQNPVDVPRLRVPAKQGETAFRGSRNPANLIPKDQAYVTYTGSFTTPPCTEDVHWIVMTVPVHGTARTIEMLRRVTGGNNRPTQRLNGRRLLNTNQE